MSKSYPTFTVNPRTGFYTAKANKAVGWSLDKTIKLLGTTKELLDHYSTILGLTRTVKVRVGSRYEIHQIILERDTIQLSKAIQVNNDNS